MTNEGNGLAPEVNERLAKLGLLDTQDLADYCKVPLATIYRWRYHRDGPRGIRVGRYVRYRMSDVQAWLDSQSDPAA
jgi:predicted DNA-binding transcriptional regulator AlpA